MHVALDRRRRLLRGRVANPQAAAEVPDRELPQLRELGRGTRERLQRQQLRADVCVHAAQRQPVDLAHARQRLVGLGEREAELRVRLAGRDLRVRVPRDIGRNAHEHRLGVRGLAAFPE